MENALLYPSLRPLGLGRTPSTEFRLFSSGRSRMVAVISTKNLLLAVSVKIKLNKVILSLLLSALAVRPAATATPRHDAQEERSMLTGVTFSATPPSRSQSQSPT
jgi:hypothetical protein